MVFLTSIFFPKQFEIFFNTLEFPYVELTPSLYILAAAPSGMYKIAYVTHIGFSKPFTIA